jgi:methionine-rich copper-binding protein CopC
MRNILLGLFILFVGCGQNEVVNTSLLQAENSLVDNISPSIVSYYPADNTTGVAPDDNITITFNEAIDNTTVSTDNSTPCSGSVQLVFSDNASNCVALYSTSSVLSNDGKTVTVDPLDNLTSETKYKIKLTNTLKDTSGNTLDNFTSTDGFTVKDWARPYLVYTNPANGATGIAANIGINITFNEAMLVSSVTTGTSTSACADTDVIQVSILADNFTSACIRMSAAPSVASDNKTFSVTPSDNLTSGGVYLIRVKSNVKDAAGNQMGSDNTTVAGFTVQ